MKHVGLLVSLVLFSGITAGATAAYYQWRQATALPDWYVAQSATTGFDEGVEDINARAVRDRLSQSFVATGETEDGVSVQGELTGDDLNQLVVAAIADDPQVGAWVDPANGFNITIEDGKLKGGVVLDISDLAELPLQEFENGPQALLNRASEIFPGLAQREIYVGIEGEPQFQDGRVLIGDDVVLRVGNVKLPLSQVIEQLGTTQQALEDSLNRELELRGVDIEAIQFEGDRAIVEGTVYQ